MKILFISYFFAPYNCSGAVRTTRTVEKLIELGHDVRIISADKQRLMSNLSTSLNETYITRTNWLDLEKPVYSLLGKKNVSSVKMNMHKNSLKSILLNYMNIVFQRIISLPDKHIGWYPYAVNASKKIIDRGWTPDVIFASATPYTSLIVAKKLSKKFKVPWAGELRDLWSDNHYGYGWWIDKKIEKFTLKTASALITVSDPLKEVLQKKYPKIPVKTITNAFDEKDFSCANNHINPSNKLKIVHTGAVYYGKRDPSPLLEVLANDKKIRKSIIVDFYGNDLGYIDYLISKYKLYDCVRTHESVSRGDALIHQRKSAALLLLTWNNPLEKGILTGKLFEYIGSSKPILSIGAIEDHASKLVIQNGFGVATNSPSEILNFLNKLLNQSFNFDINNRHKYERTEQVIKLQKILYDISNT